MRYVEETLRGLATRPLSSWLLRAALSVPTFYHGLWNLGAEGAQFWIRDSGLPPGLRFVIGTAEICASLAIVSGLLGRLAACGLLLIFLGAIPQHFAAGFSFKHGGYEPVVVYALLALAVIVERPASKTPALERSP